jgi:ribonuclease BN (tRNA processing enzyme)
MERERGVRVRILGSGDAFGSGGRLQTCILVEAEGARLLLDCGATSLVALRRGGVDPNDVAAVAVSHLHGDHFGGLPFLILDAQFRRRPRPLAVLGPPGTSARLRDTMEGLFPGSSSVERRFAVDVVELAPRVPATVGPATVRAFPVDHPSGAPALALRVEVAGRVVAYSGDTAWTEALAEAADGADLFIVEAYTFERPVRYHLDYRTLADRRDRLRCRRIILTHMSDDMLRHLDRLDPTWAEPAEDGLAVVV